MAVMVVYKSDRQAVADPPASFSVFPYLSDCYWGIFKINLVIHL